MNFRLTLLLLVFLAIGPSIVRALTLETISVEPGSKSCTITIRGDGELKSNGVIVDKPPRVVLDFPDTRSKLPASFNPRENDFVSRIRSGSLAGEGGNQKGTRVVMDLKHTLNFSISQVERGVAITLTPFKQDSQTQPASTAPKSTKGDIPESLDIVIGAEDLLDITVFELPQFNVTARVAGDGSITMPLIGSVPVRGLTKKEVELKIESALAAKYINNPSVSVAIKEYKSRQVSILGAVNNPGAYTIISPRTLLQLLSEAGGLSPNAGRRCFIFRQGASRIEIDLQDLMNNGNPALNVQILPGDVINIPAETKITVYVLGAVRNPGAVELTSSMPVTLLAAIARAGGPSEQASKSGIQIRRRDASGQEQVIKANLKDILSGKAPDVELQPGDVINVPESFF